MEKLLHIIEISKERKIDTIIQVGDFFHSPTPALGLIAKTINVLKTTTAKWYVIHGQHDLLNHASAAQYKSALSVLESAVSRFIVLRGGSLCGEARGLTIGSAPFGVEPPDMPELSGTTILVAHVMVGDKPLWPGHDLTGPEAYVKKHPGFDLYAIGDYHFPFSVKVGDAWVINAGCVLRMTADERDRTRRPKVVLFDTETGPEDIYLDVTPEAEAFDMDGYEVDKAAAARQASFAEMAASLSGTVSLGGTLKESLRKMFEEEKIPQAVCDKVWSLWDTTGI